MAPLMLFDNLAAATMSSSSMQKNAFNRTPRPAATLPHVVFNASILVPTTGGSPLSRGGCDCSSPLAISASPPASPKTSLSPAVSGTSPMSVVPTGSAACGARSLAPMSCAPSMTDSQSTKLMELTPTKWPTWHTVDNPCMPNTRSSKRCSKRLRDHCFKSMVTSPMYLRPTATTGENVKSSYAPLW